MKKTNSFLFPLALVLLGLLSCQQNDGPLTPKEYRLFVENQDNRLIQSQQVGELIYHSRYLPASYQALRELNFAPRDSFAFAKVLENYEGHHYLLLQVQPAQRGTSLQKIFEESSEGTSWTEVNNHLNFQAQKHFQLQDGKRALSCSLYQAFPGISPSDGLSFMLIFKDDAKDKKAQGDGNLRLTFQDDHLSKQLISFTFAKEHLSNIPSLKSLDSI
ncbi:MAG: hypothetical protein AAFV95_19005 [Bacteroidota bacterium]